MLRLLYRWLLCLHPPAFRRRYAEEMMWIFDEAAAQGVASLFADALVSLTRQWVMRSASSKPVTRVTALRQFSDFVPIFLVFDVALPKVSALIQGSVISFGLLSGVCLIASHPGAERARQSSSFATKVAARSQIEAFSHSPARISVRPTLWARLMSLAAAPAPDDAVPQSQQTIGLPETPAAYQLGALLHVINTGDY